MLSMLEQEINKLNIFQGNLPEIVMAIADSIPSQTIPHRMKVAIAISEIILYVSQFRINIKHWNDSIIPINSIMFCVAKSGAAKDSSVKAARKCFKSGYDLLQQYRKKLAIERAISAATKAGCEDPDKFSSYKEFYSPPNPLFVAISTTEGFIQHLNDLTKDNVGAGFIQSGEIGAELCSNANLTDNIKTLAELYDEGSKEVKMIKARENQSKEIKNIPVSALFMGSQDNLLFDESIKRKFKTEFTTKLARRSFFIFVHEDIVPANYASISDMLKQERLIEDKAKDCRYKVDSYIEGLTKDLIEFAGNNITISEEVRDLFLLYKKYNEATAELINNQFPIAKLTRTHLQWKALKLSGAMALIDGMDTINKEHYLAAMEFVELINQDVNIFERELTKEPYELFANYAHTYATNGELTVGLHTLRKAGFMPIKGLSETQLKELTRLVNSYDEHGIYTLKQDSIYFKEIRKTDTILLSYVQCTGTKAQRKSRCATGFQCEELTFTDLEEMLQDDYAYSPFKFEGGVRSKDNIISGCKWIIMDVDDSEITDEEAHILLSDINHFIIRTSDKNNPNKYRVLIELDTEVEIPDIQWISFIQSIANDLGLKADPLAKSQIAFSYSDRNILKITDVQPLTVKPYLNIVSAITPVEAKKLNSKACSALLADPMTTFDKAFNAPDGSGRRRLIWACRRARELGASRDYCKNLLDQITSYWVKGFPEDDLDTMKRQLDRWNFNEE